MTINANLGVQDSTKGQTYPAIQAACYKPRDFDDEIPLVLSEDSYLMLSTESQQLMVPLMINYTSGRFLSMEDFRANEIKYRSLSGEWEPFFGIPKNWRFVFWGLPRSFTQIKKDNHLGKKGAILALKQGQKMRENDLVSATRCLISVVTDNGFLIDLNGSIQFFTLKLTSTKTCLIDSYNDPDYKSLTKLNKTIIEQEKLSAKSSYLHLVSVALKVTPKQFTSSLTNDSSMGILFEIDGGYKPLPDNLQQSAFAMRQSDEVMEFLADPFFLNRKKEQSDQSQYIETENTFDHNVPF